MGAATLPRQERNPEAGAPQDAQVHAVADDERDFGNELRPVEAREGGMSAASPALLITANGRFIIAHSLTCEGCIGRRPVRLCLSSSTINSG